MIAPIQEYGGLEIGYCEFARLDCLRSENGLQIGLREPGVGRKSVLKCWEMADEGVQS